MKYLKSLVLALATATTLLAFAPAAEAGCKIYRGSSGYDVAFRIDGVKIYRGRSGYDVAGRADNCSHSEAALAAMVL